MKRTHPQDDPTSRRSLPVHQDPADSSAGTRPVLPRRDLVKLLGASVGLAGLGACTQRPREKILPYSREHAELTPGVPVQYATSMVLDGFSIGLLVNSHEGRPTKIEGNPDHPASLGATGVLEQASVLELYDPMRLAALSFAGAPTSWQHALSGIARELAAGPPPWFVLYPQSSPLLGSWLDRLRERYPGARFSFHSPLARSAVYAATKRLYGRPLEIQYDFRRARVVVDLEADFLEATPMSVRWARDFAERRRVAHPADRGTRLYVAEAMPSPTGSLADHRLALRSSEVARFAAALLGELRELGKDLSRLPEALRAALPSAAAVRAPELVRALARELAQAPGESIVIAGDRQPIATHLLAHALNLALDNFGRTLRLTDPALLDPAGGEPLSDLVAGIASGAVQNVVILEANPVYGTSPELELGRWLARARNSVHLSYFYNETSRACRWVLPASHYLESWGDARAYDGTHSYVQPLIRPRVPARSSVELIAALAGANDPSAHRLLNESFLASAGARAPRELEEEWEARLARGMIRDSAFAAQTAEPDWGGASDVVREALARAPSAALELELSRSPTSYDGRFANNAWLLELPHPTTKQCWGNAAIVSPATARELGVEEDGQELELSVGQRRVRAPALVLAGHADSAVTLTLGYGRTGREELAAGVGVNAFALLDAAGSSSIAGLEVRALAARERLALAQTHTDDRGRPLAVSMTLADYRANPEATAPLRAPQPSLLPEDDYQGTQWAMTIDTMICTGCSACVLACQAENNVPVVGKDGVLRSREMHWLRVDRYSVGPAEAPRFVNQPMLCQHCEKAPCEYVCPVNATVHSPDGLSEMVYNRCVGTRFCSNNCPYKVRRFNWFDYSEAPSPRALQRNPDVTVRERGVMEKCSFCVQRLRRAGQRARVERREIRSGEVTTACAQACPTGAIQFAALNHHDTAMAQWRKEPRVYAALHDLGTQPRVLYLAKLDNPNPELGGRT